MKFIFKHVQIRGLNTFENPKDYMIYKIKTSLYNVERLGLYK